MNMVTESNRLDYGDKLVEFYNNLDWGWLFDFVREKYGIGMVRPPEVILSISTYTYHKTFWKGRFQFMNKELFVITCIRGDETTELGKYLLKAGMEAPLDFFKNVLKKSEPINVNISTTADGSYLVYDQTNERVKYVLNPIPLDDKFWDSCTASAKE